MFWAVQREIWGFLSQLSYFQKGTEGRVSVECQCVSVTVPNAIPFNLTTVQNGMGIGITILIVQKAALNQPNDIQNHTCGRQGSLDQNPKPINKLLESESHSVMSNSLQPHGLYGSTEFSRPEYWSEQLSPSPGDLPNPEDLPNPGIKPRSPALQAGSLPSEPPGKPKNTGVGSLSLLQETFPTHRPTWGLLHCRGILYH